MSPSTRKTIVLSVLAALAGLSATAEAESHFLAGNENSLWLVRHEKGGGVFRLLVRPEESQPNGGKWRWLDNQAGRPIAAVAAGDRLFLLLHSKHGLSCLAVNQAGDSTILPSLLESQPAEALLPAAACEAHGLAGADREDILAVLPMPPLAATQPTSAPGKQKADNAPDEGERLTVFVLAGSSWKQVTQSPEKIGAGDRLLAAATQGKLYILVTREGRNRLASWNGGHWAEVPLQETLVKADVLAAIALSTKGQEPGERHLTLVYAEPAEGDRLRLRTAVLDNAGAQFSSQPVIDAAGQQASWSKDQVPMASQLGTDAAAVWLDAQGLHLGMITPSSGRMWKTETSDVLQKGPIDQGGMELLSYVLTGVLVAACLLTFLVRSPRTPKLFSLPAGYLPGNLIRRALATVIDLVPFSLLLSFVAPLPISAAAGTDDVWAVLTDYLRSSRAAYGLITLLALYGAYATLTEFRWGATLGKRLMQLRVLGDEGSALDLRSAGLRNLWKLLELTITLASFLTMISAMMNPYRRRLGDLLARTVVVDSRSRPAASGQPDPPPDI